MPFETTARKSRFMKSSQPEYLARLDGEIIAMVSGRWWSSTQAASFGRDHRASKTAFCNYKGCTVFASDAALN